MLKSTVEFLRCPSCEDRGKLVLNHQKGDREASEVSSGNLQCQSCHKDFPILGGVALLVEDVETYLCHHVKGISKVVPEQEIPALYREAYIEAKYEWQESAREHFEEDLESERVTALYLMTHYLKASQIHSPSPVIQKVIEEYWDHGPFAQIKSWLKQDRLSVVELGCGVGGLARALESNIERYIGVDSSFASIALARHLNCGVPYPQDSFFIPDDLILGQLSRQVQIPVAVHHHRHLDFVVSDFERPPVRKGSWDVAIALNALDMVDEPKSLAKAQFDLARAGGRVIQSCPYIWHETVAEQLRKEFAKEWKGRGFQSSEIVESLYEKLGLKIKERVDHIPWLFFKHGRQLEVYSVHAFIAQK